MKIRIKLISALLVFAIMLGGCTTIGADTAWVYSKDGAQMPAGLYISYQISAYQDAQELYYNQNSSAEGFTMPTKTSEMLSVNIEGMTAQQWIENRTLEYVKLYYYSNEKFVSMGLEEDSYLKQAAQYTAQSIWSQSGDAFDKNNIARSSIELRSLSDLKLQTIFEKIYGEGGEQEVSGDDLKKAFESDYICINVLSPSKQTTVPEGYVKSVDEFNAEIKALLDAAVPRIEAGESVTEVFYGLEKQFAKLSGDDESTVTPLTQDDINLIITKDNIETYRISYPEMISAAETAAYNKPQVIETADMYLLLNRINVLEQEGLFESYRPTVLYSVKYDEFEQDAFSEASSIELQANTKAVRSYKLKDLVV